MDQVYPVGQIVLKWHPAGDLGEPEIDYDVRYTQRQRHRTHPARKTNQRESRGDCGPDSGERDSLTVEVEVRTSDKVDEEADEIQEPLRTGGTQRWRERQPNIGEIDQSETNHRQHTLAEKAGH